MGRETNKSRRQSQSQSAREKAAAARAAQRRTDQRRRALVILSSVVAVAVVGAVIAVVAVTSKGKNNPADDAKPAPAAVAQAVQNVSASTLATVGAGNVATHPTPVTGKPPLVDNGKPEVLYIGAEFCPYCAIERWALAEGLSQFGSFGGLDVVRSGDTDGDFASLDFRNATYTSKYIAFVPVEAADRNQNKLQSVSASQTALWASLTKNETFPFIDFGNKFALAANSPLDPTVLGSLDQEQVAQQLNDPSSKIAQTISGGANDVIAAVCSMTGNKPGKVCSSSLISGLQSQMSQAS